MFRRVIASAAAVVAVAAGVSAAATPAQAASCPIDARCVTTYYSSGSYTTVIGQAGYDCGTFFQWGRTSSYFKKFVGGCI